MPRAGFNWRPNPGLTVTGGFGLFSGGNPGVYTYDSFDNPGNLLGLHTYTCSTASCATQSTALTGAGSSALINVTGSSIPAAVQQDITNSAKLGTGTANALAPGFKPPSVWKASLSLVQVVDFNDYRDSSWGKYTAWLGDGWRFHGDLLGDKTQEAVFWQDIWAMQNTLTSRYRGRARHPLARSRRTDVRCSIPTATRRRRPARRRGPRGPRARTSC